MYRNTVYKLYMTGMRYYTKCVCMYTTVSVSAAILLLILRIAWRVLSWSCCAQSQSCMTYRALIALDSCIPTFLCDVWYIMYAGDMWMREKINNVKASLQCILILHKINKEHRGREGRKYTRGGRAEKMLFQIHFSCSTYLYTHLHVVRSLLSSDSHKPENKEK